MVLLFLPLIPILLGAIGGGTLVTAIWYGNLSPKERERENKDLARRITGKKFDDDEEKKELK